MFTPASVESALSASSAGPPREMSNVDFDDHITGIDAVLTQHAPISQSGLCGGLRARHDAGQSRCISGQLSATGIHCCAGQITDGDETAQTESRHDTHDNRRGSPVDAGESVSSTRQSSSSAPKIGATDATVWPSSRLMTRTPVASRPCDEMSRTAIRIVTPPDETATMSSSRPTMNAATT
jgi:hypothetical protein